jgi:5,10-methylenetetrahydrofolate reductase
MIPAIRDVLKNDPGSQGSVEEHYAVGIRKVADITGDGLTEALVYLGTGGASTDALTLMRIENDKPV